VASSLFTATIRRDKETPACRSQHPPGRMHSPRPIRGIRQLVGILTASIILIGVVQPTISRNPRGGERVRTAVRPAINNNWSAGCVNAKGGRTTLALARRSRKVGCLGMREETLIPRALLTAASRRGRSLAEFRLLRLSSARHGAARRGAARETCFRCDVDLRGR